MSDEETISYKEQTGNVTLSVQFIHKSTTIQIQTWSRIWCSSLWNNDLWVICECGLYMKYIQKTSSYYPKSLKHLKNTLKITRIQWHLKSNM